MNEITNDEYWDCECEHQYIHKKTDRLICPKCGAISEEMPDSLQIDIDAKTHFFEP